MEHPEPVLIPGWFQQPFSLLHACDPLHLKTLFWLSSRMRHQTETHSRYSLFSNTLSVPVVTRHMSTVNRPLIKMCQRSTVNALHVVFFLKRDVARERRNIVGGPGQRYRRVDDTMLRYVQGNRTLTTRAVPLYKSRAEISGIHMLVAVPTAVQY